MESDLERKINTLAQWMFEARYLVVFTGAGISTESGLPDFRGPNGIWTRMDKGLPPKSMPAWDSVQPNKGHLAIVELQNLGKLKFLISQNVDNLHLKSGINPELLAELHGNIAKLRCESLRD
ncbi:MAG: NAD-dependent protein deacetylase [Candidatus Bathyarchaeota archaeon BA2]|nr:MAG: NAD-dependent protein deacetylase [Candidatus Bathyarchaeota archaeon BA2]